MLDTNDRESPVRYRLYLEAGANNLALSIKKNRCLTSPMHRLSGGGGKWMIIG